MEFNLETSQQHIQKLGEMIAKQISIVGGLLFSRNRFSVSEVIKINCALAEAVVQFNLKTISNRSEGD